jgi:Domain of unknown function (DUF397)
LVNYVIAACSALGNSVIIYADTLRRIVEHLVTQTRHSSEETMAGLTPEGAAKFGSDSRWIKSSLSFSNSNCVEVASLPDDEIGVRDSKDAEGPVLRFTPGEWNAFLGGVQNGEFDHFSRM